MLPFPRAAGGRSAAPLLSALALLALAAPSAGYSAGYDSCDRNMPAHGVNNNGQAGGFSIAVTAGGAPVTAWQAGATYTVTVTAPAGSTFRGVILAPFLASAQPAAAPAAVDWTTGAMHGALAPSSAQALRAMTSCAGGVTQSSAADRASQSATWTPGAAGSGAATLAATVIVGYSAANWEVRRDLPELAPSPGASVVPAPSASPSAPAKTACANAVVSSTPRPNAAMTANASLTPVYSNGGWSGAVTLGSIHLSWTVLAASAEVAFSAWHQNSNTIWDANPGPYYLSVALATGNKMTYPTSGFATVGYAFGGVSQVLMRGYATTDMKAGPMLGIRAASCTFTNRTSGTKQVTITDPPKNVTTYNATSGLNMTRLTPQSHRITAPNFLYTTTMNWTRAFNTWVCEDHQIDPNGVVGMIYAVGQQSAFGPHSGESYDTFKLLGPGAVYVKPSSTPSASWSPSASVTPTASRSFGATSSPTGSRTPSPSPTASMAVAGGGASGGDPLAGSALLDDILVSWRVNPAAQTVAYSLSAAGRVWLSLAVGTKLKMTAPECDLAVTAQSTTTCTTPTSSARNALEAPR